MNPYIFDDGDDEQVDLHFTFEGFSFIVDESDNLPWWSYEGDEPSDNVTLRAQNEWTYKLQPMVKHSILGAAYWDGRLKKANAAVPA
jgi:hypothetical protein